MWRVDWAHPEFGQLLVTCSFDRTAAVWEEQSRSTNNNNKKNDSLSSYAVSDAKASDSEPSHWVEMSLKGQVLSIPCLPFYRQRRHLWLIAERL